MPSHKHLKRLARVWIRDEIYFITTCTHQRQRLLSGGRAFQVIQDELAGAITRHGWHVGRFVLMPDHLHFFCAPGTAPKSNLSTFVGSFKEWTAKRICEALDANPPLWQKEFFDHLLRSSASYEDKWRYVAENPVRAGLAASPEAYPWQGEIEPLTL